MAEISKQALIVENNQSFPNNNTNFITPARLRDFNTNMIDSNVNQIVYNTDSGSWNNSLDLINQYTASFSASVDLTALNDFTASQEATNSVVSDDIDILYNTKLNTSSFNSYTSSNDTKWSDLGSQSGSWITESETGSFARTDADNIFSGVQTFNDVVVNGTASVALLHVTIESSSVIYSSGSNQFGDAANDVQTLYGSTRIVNELTASGLNYPTADNGDKSFMQTDGNGNLSFQYVDTIWEAFYAGESVSKGTPLYFSGSNGANPIAYAADAADANKMPVIVIAAENITAGNVYEGNVLGLIEGLDLTGYEAGQTVYVAEGGGWSTSLPSGSSSITQVLGIVTKGGSGGKGLVLNPGPAQLPVLQTDYVWLGNGSNRAAATSKTALGLALTGSANEFNGNQTVNGFISASNGFYSGPNTTALNIGDGSNLRFWSGSTGGSEYFNVQLVPGVGDIAFSRSGASNVKVFTLAGVEGYNTTFQNNPVVFNDSVSSLTVNAQSTAISGSGSYSVQASTITETATSVTTAASASVRGTFSVTGQSGGDGRAILLGHSGSLVIGNSSTNSDYAGLLHISSSQANSNTNLIFKNSTTAADTIVSGSANIFANPAAPTSGFKRYVGTSNIYTHGSSVPQLSGSMAWSPTMNGNIFSHTQTNAFTWRGPTTLTTGVGQVNHNIFMGGLVNMGTDATNNAEKLVNGVVVNNNAIFGGNINVIAYKTTVGGSTSIAGNLLFGAGVTLNHHSSSALNYTSNIQNGGVTVNNEYEPTGGSVTPAKIARTSLNTVYGHQHSVNFKGTNVSTTQTKHFYANILAGMYLSASVETGDSGNILATGMLGNNLIVSGSSTAAAATTQYSPNDTQGSVFVGRYNSVDGTKAKSAETIFAVGTGRAASRKTGFLIDSGSNAFIEGSLNISGSVNGVVQSLSVSSNTASIDFNRGNIFTLDIPTGTTTHIDATNIKSGQTINLLVSQDAAATGSLEFAPNFKFSYFNQYSVTAITGSKDILTFVTFDTTNVYASSVKNLI